MRNYIFILVLFISSSVFGQDYKLIKPQRIAHFEYLEYGINSKFISVRIDTSYLLGSDSILENYNILSEDAIFSYCQDARDTNFFLSKIQLKPNDDHLIFNRVGDTIKIQTKANIGSQWILYQFPNGNYLRADLISHTYQNVLSIMDSVKTITIQAFDSGNNPVSHPFNGKNISWSKNHGLIKLYSTINFPNDTTTYNLVGMNNPELGITNLTWPQINNWNIGDEFHYYGEDNQAPLFALYDWEKLTVTNKIISVTGDTIIYTRERQYYREEYSFNPFVMTPTNLNVTLTDTIFVNKKSRIDNLSFESFFGSGNYENGYLYQTQTADFGNRRKKVVHPYFWNDGDTCLSIATGWCIHPIITYAENIGLLRSEDCYLKDLVYYSKGTEVWGSPINFPSVKELNSLHKIEIFPNPGNGIININSENKFSDISISDMTGRIILNQKINNENNIQLNLPEINSGIYFINIRFENGTTFSEKWIKE